MEGLRTQWMAASTAAPWRSGEAACGTRSTRRWAKARPFRTAPLCRRSGVFSYEWNDKWCVLHPACLLYYFDHESNSTPGGVHLLTSRTTVQVHPQHGDRTWVLEVHVDPTDAAARKFFFQADSEAEARAWADAIARFHSTDRLVFEQAETQEQLQAAQDALETATAAVKDMEVRRDAALQSLGAAQDGMHEASTALRQLCREADAAADELAKAAMAAYTTARSGMVGEVHKPLLPPPYVPAASGEQPSTPVVQAAAGGRQTRSTSWSDDMASSTKERGGRPAGDVDDRAALLSRTAGRLLQARTERGKEIGGGGGADRSEGHAIGVDDVAARLPSGAAMDLEVIPSAASGRQALLVSSQHGKELSQAAVSASATSTGLTAAAGAGVDASSDAASSAATSTVVAPGGQSALLAPVRNATSALNERLLKLQRLVAYVTAHAMPWWAAQARQQTLALAEQGAKLTKYKGAILKLAHKAKAARAAAGRRKAEAITLRASLLSLQAQLSAAHRAHAAVARAGGAGDDAKLQAALEATLRQLYAQHAFFTRVLGGLTTDVAESLGMPSPGRPRSRSMDNAPSPQHAAAPLPPHAHMLGVGAGSAGAAHRVRSRSSSLGRQVSAPPPSPCVRTALDGAARQAAAQQEAERKGRGGHLSIAPLRIPQPGASSPHHRQDSLLGLHAALRRAQTGLRAAFEGSVSQLTTAPVYGALVSSAMQPQGGGATSSLPPAATPRQAGRGKERTSPSSAHHPAPSCPEPRPAPRPRGTWVLRVVEARNLPLPHTWAPGHAPAASPARSKRPSWMGGSSAPRTSTSGTAAASGPAAWGVALDGVPPSLVKALTLTGTPIAQAALCHGGQALCLTGGAPLSHERVPGDGGGSGGEDAGWHAEWDADVSAPEASLGGDVLRLAVHVAPEPAPAGPPPAQGGVHLGAVLGAAAVDASSCREWPWQPHALWVELKAPEGGSAASVEGRPTIPRLAPSSASAQRPASLPTFQALNDLGVGCAVPCDAAPSPAEIPVPVGNLPYYVTKAQLKQLCATPGILPEAVGAMPSSGRWAAPTLPPCPAGNVPCLLLQVAFCPTEAPAAGLPRAVQWFMEREAAAEAERGLPPDAPLRQAITQSLEEEMHSAGGAQGAEAGQSGSADAQASAQPAGLEAAVGVSEEEGGGRPRSLSALSAISGVSLDGHDLHGLMEEPVVLPPLPPHAATAAGATPTQGGQASDATAEEVRELKHKLKVLAKAYKTLQGQHKAVVAELARAKA